MLYRGVTFVLQAARSRVQLFPPLVKARRSGASDRRFSPPSEVVCCFRSAWRFIVTRLRVVPVCRFPSPKYSVLYAFIVPLRPGRVCTKKVGSGSASWRGSVWACARWRRTFNSTPGCGEPVLRVLLPSGMDLSLLMRYHGNNQSPIAACHLGTPSNIAHPGCGIMGF